MVHGQGCLGEAYVVFQCPRSGQRRSFGILEFFSAEVGRGVDSVKLVLRAYPWGMGRAKMLCLGEVGVWQF